MAFSIEILSPQQYEAEPELAELHTLGLEVYANQEQRPMGTSNQQLRSAKVDSYVVARDRNLRAKFKPSSHLPHDSRLRQLVSSPGFMSTYSGPLVYSELAELVTWEELAEKQGVYLGAFTAHPLLSHEQKVAVLHDMMTDLFNNQLTKGIISQVFLLTIESVAKFATEAGITLSEVPSAQTNRQSQVVINLQKAYPRYWNLDQHLYQVELQHE